MSKFTNLNYAIDQIAEVREALFMREDHPDFDRSLHIYYDQLYSVTHTLCEIRDMLCGLTKPTEQAPDLAPELKED